MLIDNKQNKCILEEWFDYKVAEREALFKKFETSLLHVNEKCELKTRSETKN